MRKEVPEVLARCWFDTAAMPFLYRPAALRAIADAAGIERVLFGTDYPLLPPSRYYRELESSGLSPEERRAVLGENALRALSPEERPSPP
jgi:predicted TIM-barrel fold metal-dependent hydrolase